MLINKIVCYLSLSYEREILVSVNFHVALFLFVLSVIVALVAVFFRIKGKAYYKSALLVAYVLINILFTSFIFNYLSGPINTGKTYYTIEKMINLSEDINRYYNGNNKYPVTLDELDISIHDKYDGWGRKMIIILSPDSYIVESHGADGQKDILESISDDIIMKNGEFISYPDYAKNKFFML